MRIESICIKNFRQYAKIDLYFPKKDHDINIIIGKNGVGKTTFLNAINWCLYNEEPHAYSKESSLPRRNLSNSEEPCYVEIRVSAADGSIITFKREENHSLIVTKKESNGETKTFRDADADMLVDSFVPLSIREFFFFDGEQLDNYFIDEKTKYVKNNVSILSHVDILELLDQELSRKLKSISRKAGAKNAKVDELNREKEVKEVALISEKEKRERAKTNLKKTSSQLKEITAKLKGIPDIENLERKRQKAMDDKNAASEDLSQIEKDRRYLFLNDSPYVFLNSAMQYVLDDIEYKKKNNELPKPIDSEVIKESLEEKVCKVCGQPLEDKKWDELNQTLTTYKMSSEQSKKLLNLESLLRVNETKVTNYLSEFNKLIEQYKKANKIYNEKSNEYKEIDKKYQLYNDESVLELSQKRSRLEADEEKYNDALSDAKANIKLLEKDINEIDQKRIDAMEKDKKIAVFKKKESFLNDAIELIQHTKEEIMQNTRRIIEEFTKNTFFDLLWKEGTYKDVKINDNYQVELIHNLTNSDSIGSASAAERELLVLAFTLGVHSISEFDSPLLIDTPLARVSDDNRVNFANTFIEISKNKQITLLLTPAEYSEEIQELFNKEDILKFEIVMANDESHSEILEVN